MSNFFGVQKTPAIDTRQAYIGKYATDTLNTNTGNILVDDLRLFNSAIDTPKSELVYYTQSLIGGISPTNLQITSTTSTTATIKYTANPAAVSYEIRTAPETSTWTTTDVSYTLTGLLPFTPYTIYVFGIQADGKRGTAAKVSILEPPENMSLVVDASNAGANATYSAAFGATTYRIETVPATSTVQTGSLSSRVSGFASPDISYTVIMYGRDTAGGLSMPVQRTIGERTPYVLISDITNTTMSLLYGAVLGASYYDIYTVPASNNTRAYSTSVDISGLSPGTAYTVYIQYGDGAGNRSFYATLSVSMPGDNTYYYTFDAGLPTAATPIPGLTKDANSGPYGYDASGVVVATGINAECAAYSPDTNKIYLFPVNSNLITIFDVSLNTTTTLNVGTSRTYKSAIYAPNTKKIYSLARTTTSTTVMLIVNPIDNTYETVNISKGNSNDYSWENGAYIPSNKTIVYIPRRDTQVLVFNTETKTPTYYSASFVSDGFIGGVYSPLTNKVYGIPFNSGTICTFDVATNTIDLTAINHGLGSAGTLYHYGILAPNGKIYCFLWSATTMLVIDPLTNTVSRPAGLNIGSQKTVYGVISPYDNKIYCAPYTAGTNVMYVIDSNTDTFSTIPFVNSAALFNTVIASNYNIYASPEVSGPIILLKNNSNNLPLFAATSSSYSSGNNPYKAFDGSGATFWSNNTGYDASGVIIATDINSLGSVYSPDVNKIYFFGSSVNITMLDVSTNSTSTFNVGTGRTYRSAIYIPDNKKIYALASNVMLIVNPTDNNSYTTVNITSSGSIPWENGAYVPYKKTIVYIPRQNGSILVFDTTNNTPSYYSYSGLGNNNFIGSVYSPLSNKVYGIPFNSATICTFNTDTNAINMSEITHGLGSNGALFHFGILGPNNKIYCFPLAATTMLLIDPTTNTATQPSGLNIGSRKTLSGVISPYDNKIYCSPYGINTNLMYVIDTSNDTFTTIPFLNSTYMFNTVISTNYNIYSTPETSGPIVRLKFNEIAYNISGNYIGLYSTTVDGVGTISGEWLQCNIQNPMRLTSYTLTSKTTRPAETPRVFSIVGSNDGTTWYPVDSKTVSVSLTPTNATYTNNNVISSNFYKYFRIITQNVYANAQSTSLVQWDISGETAVLANYNTNSLIPTYDGSNQLISINNTTYKRGSGSMFLNAGISQYATLPSKTYNNAGFSAAAWMHVPPAATTSYTLARDLSSTSLGDSLGNTSTTDISNNFAITGATFLAEWTSRTIGAYTWRKICWCPELNIFVAVANGTNIVGRSSDGITWNTSATFSASSNWYDVCWSPQLRLFVAVSGNGLINTSNDGITWTPRTAPNLNIWISVCWSPELSLFVAIAYNGTNLVMTSSDGINWTPRSPTGSTYECICWSPEKQLFVAVGNTSILRSSDGINWTLTTVSPQLLKVEWSSTLGIFCITGRDTIMTSTDGITWSTTSISNDWRGLTWAPEVGLFVASSTNLISGTRIITSRDGINWTYRTPSEQNTWYTIAWSPQLQLFVALSDSGTTRGMSLAAKKATIVNYTATVPTTTKNDYILAIQDAGITKMMLVELNLSAGAVYAYKKESKFVNSALTLDQTTLNSNYAGATAATSTYNVINMKYSFPKLNHPLFEFGGTNVDSSRFSNIAVSGTGNYWGAVAAPNNRIYMIPSNAANVLVVDPSTNTAVATIPVAAGAGAYKWTSGILAPNGKIYGVPMDSTSVLIIDPSTNTVDTTTITGITGTNKFIGGAIAPNGKIYCPPYGSGVNYVLVINTNTNTTSQIAVSGTGWSGAVLANNGLIYCVPYSSTATSVMIINPNTDTANTTTIPISGTNMYGGGALAPNGNIYCVPMDVANIMIINPTTNTINQSAIVLSDSTTGKYRSAVCAPNGRIYGIPSNATNVLIIDPSSNTFNTSTIATGLTTLNKLGGGAVGFNGKIYVSPYDASGVYVISPYVKSVGIDISNGFPRFSRYSHSTASLNTTLSYTLPSKIIDNSWNHLGISADTSGQWTLYLNGLPYPTGITDMFCAKGINNKLTLTQNYIGRYLSDTGATYTANMYVDDFRAYSNSMDLSFVNMLYYGSGYSNTSFSPTNLSVLDVSTSAIRISYTANPKATSYIIRTVPETTTTSTTSTDLYITGISPSPLTNVYQVYVYGVNSSGYVSYPVNSITTLPILEYPPSALSSLSTTLTGQNYGNGTYTCSVSSSYVGAIDAVDLFNKSLSDLWHGGTTANDVYNDSTGIYKGNKTTVDITSTSHSGEWMQITLPTSILLTKIAIGSSIGNGSDDIKKAPRNFVILGSNNGGSTWTLIHTTTDFIGWSGNTLREFAVSTTSSYSTYRVVIKRIGTSNNGTQQSYVFVSEWILYGKASM